MNPRHWSSDAAHALCRVTGHSDPVAAMIARADALLDEAAVAGPPVPLAVLASFQGIRSIETIDIVASGRLIVHPEGSVVQVNRAESPARRQFTIAHEIAHTLLPAYAAHPRLIPKQSEVEGRLSIGDRGAHVAHAAKGAPARGLDAHRTGLRMPSRRQRDKPLPRKDSLAACPSRLATSWRVRELVEEPQSCADPGQVPRTQGDGRCPGKQRARDRSVGAQRAKRVDASGRGRAGIPG